eukprot:754735-Hanusia_phi.AAC.2
MFPYSAITILLVFFSSPIEMSKKALSVTCQEFQSAVARGDGEGRLTCAFAFPSGVVRSMDATEPSRTAADSSLASTTDT